MVVFRLQVVVFEERTIRLAGLSTGPTGLDRVPEQGCDIGAAKTLHFPYACR